MKGFIYIASAFHTVNRSKCGQGVAWVDSDPHFWTPTEPPTWGICRNDLRRRVEDGDFIFFVLPRHGHHPQMIFAYLKVAEKITHLEAFHRSGLISKRMGNKNPNGNIIVDAKGNYNRFDAHVHEKIFEKVKGEYVIGVQENSKMFTASEIASKAPTFIATLSSIIGITGKRAIDIISRKGRELSASQVNSLLSWLK